jgi:hypothetical protein
MCMDNLTAILVAGQPDHSFFCFKKNYRTVTESSNRAIELDHFGFPQACGDGEESAKVVRKEHRFHFALCERRGASGISRLLCLVRFCN